MSDRRWGETIGADALAGVLADVLGLVGAVVMGVIWFVWLACCAVASMFRKG